MGISGRFCWPSFREHFVPEHGWIFSPHCDGAQNAADLQLGRMLPKGNLVLIIYVVLVSFRTFHVKQHKTNKLYCDQMCTNVY